MDSLKIQSRAQWTPTPSAGSRVREEQLHHKVDRGHEVDVQPHYDVDWGQEVDSDNICFRVEEYTASE
jgi:hypothetical protein